MCPDFVSCIAFLDVLFLREITEDFIHVICGPRDVCF